MFSLHKGKVIFYHEKQNPGFMKSTEMLQNKIKFSSFQYSIKKYLSLHYIFPFPPELYFLELLEILHLIC